METIVDIGSHWAHRNGCGPYEVIAIANEGSPNGYQEQVVYKGPNGKIWTKETSNFLDRMSKSGCLIKDRQNQTPG